MPEGGSFVSKEAEKLSAGDALMIFRSELSEAGRSRSHSPLRSREGGSL